MLTCIQCRIPLKAKKATALGPAPQGLPRGSYKSPKKKKNLRNSVEKVLEIRSGKGKMLFLKQLKWQGGAREPAPWVVLGPRNMRIRPWHSPTIYLRWHFIGPASSSSNVKTVMRCRNLFMVETLQNIKVANQMDEILKRSKREEKLNVMVQSMSTQIAVNKYLLNIDLGPSNVSLFLIFLS